MNRRATSAGEALTDVFARMGVECVFGVPGTQNVALFETLRRSRGRGVRTVLTTHELAATFAANGYARASGRPGVVAAIPGPGFMFALTGIAEARLDSIPLVLISGPPATTPGKAFQLQAIDQASIAGPLLKGGVFQVTRAQDLAPTVAAALVLALHGEPGPVLVQFDSDLLSGDAQIVSDLPPLEPGTGPAAVAKMHDGVARLVAAHRPVIVAGQGAHGSADALRTLIERLGAPVVTTASGRGVLPEEHPLALGFDALRGGHDALNALFADSDCVVALGAKLGHNGSAGFGLRLPPDRLIHVDTDGTVPGANYPASLSIESTVEAFVTAALAGGRGAAVTGWDSEAIRRCRERCRAVTQGDPPEPIIQGAERGSPAAFFGALRRALPNDAILVTDSGLHQVLARRHFEVRAPRGLVLPSDFQSMGFGVPAAIGAKLAAPHRPVVAVVGDGGFLMTGMELITAVREQIPLTVIVFNDGQLNLIRLQQLRTFGRAHAVELRTPNLADFAAAIGAAYLAIGAAEDLEVTLGKALRSPGPVIVEVWVGDSTAVHAVRAQGLVRETVRRALGPRVIGWIKRLLGR